MEMMVVPRDKEDTLRQQSREGRVCQREHCGLSLRFAREEHSGLSLRSAREEHAGLSLQIQHLS